MNTTRRLTCLAALCACACALSLASVASAGWLAGYDYRQEITVNPSVTPGDLAGFPLLVQIADPSNDVFANAASPSGLDVVFTKANGVTTLPREIERYSSATGQLDAWVKTDVSRSAATKLYMYYNGPAAPGSAATWDASYQMVQHLQENTAAAGGHLDSTANANHGTPYSSTTIANLHTPSGQINGGVSLDGANDRVQVADSASLDITGALTIEAWVRPDVSKTAEMFMKGTGGGAEACEFFQGGNRIYWRLNNNAKTISSAATMAIGGWNHVVATYDPSLPSANMKLFVNGAQDTNTGDYTAALVTNSLPFVIGAYPDDRYAFDGLIDEVRISDVARDADWVAASYNNQANTATYQGAAAEEKKGWLPGYAYRQAITLSSAAADADLDDFPALIKLTDAMNGVFANAAPSGRDIVFTDGDGTTLLHRDLEHYSNASGAEELCAWVKTSLSATDDSVIYMYYGGADAADSTDAWDDDFRLVQHLQEDPSGTPPPQMIDSTQYHNDGTSGGAMTTGDQVPGAVDGCLDFDGSNDLVNCGNDSSLDLTDAITLEAWVHPDASVVKEMFIKGLGTAAAFEFYQSGTTVTWALANRGLRITSTNAMTMGAWNHIVATFDKDLSSANAKIYINGVLDPTTGTRTTALTTTTQPFVIAAYPNGQYSFDGKMDEVRLSAVARSGDWILASYRFQSAPGDYATFGAQQIPEPATLSLLGLGALALLRRRRR